MRTPTLPVNSIPVKTGVFITLALAGTAAWLNASGQAGEPVVEAGAALLVDAQTGQVLFAKNENARHAPASTIKLLTALLVWERTGLRGAVQILPADTQVEPSHVPLRAGEVVTVSDLANTLLIGSDNDSALALARHSAGSVGEFVALMNERARQLGCAGTAVKNPHGLPAKGQFTTAGDLMKIFSAALAVPALKNICAMPRYRLTTQIGAQTVKNHNKLLDTYPGMGAAKTGWTAASRHTYAASASRGGRELRLVILNSPNKWNDAKILFDYGFGETSAAPVLADRQPPPAAVVTQPVTVYRVKKGDTLSAICRRFDVSMKSVLRRNHLPDPHKINPGLVLYIPLQS